MEVIEPSHGHAYLISQIYEERNHMLLVMTAATTSALVTPDALHHASRLLERAYSLSYAERLMIGRKAQFGDELVYRPGAIGSNVNTALTYGEYDLGFFAQCVDCALEGVKSSHLTFVDVGSGVGRLVLAAATLWPERFSRCAGVEFAAELHRLACDADGRVSELLSDASSRQFICGDAAEALGEGGCLADAHILFAYSSAFASEGDLLSDFSAVCGTNLRVGSRVVTTDRRLCSVDGLWRFEVLDVLEGVNQETGGKSVGYVQEVVQSVRR